MFSSFRVRSVLISLFCVRLALIGSAVVCLFSVACSSGGAAPGPADEADLTTVPESGTTSDIALDERPEATTEAWTDLSDAATISDTVGSSDIASELAPELGSFDIVSDQAAELAEDIVYDLLADVPALDCPAGHVGVPGAGCLQVGLQGCAEEFIDEDGLCRPTLDKCPGGHIPKSDSGCVPVGIQNCADIFIDDDGVCRPSTDKCPAGKIPVFDSGCVPVGIANCAPVFMEDGVCLPSFAKCPQGTIPVPSKGCLNLTSPSLCQGGTWGNIPYHPDNVYVLPAAPPGGTGKPNSPLDSVQQALTQVKPGGTVVLGPGDYFAPVFMANKSANIVGVCPHKVRLRGNWGGGNCPPSALILNNVQNVKISGVQVQGLMAGICLVGVSAVMLENVFVVDSGKAGVLVRGGGPHPVLIHNVMVQNAFSYGGSFAGGIHVREGGQVVVQESAVLGCATVGIEVASESSLELSDSLVEGTQHGTSSAAHPAGVLGEYAGFLAIANSAIISNYLGGIVVFGGQAHIETSLVDNTYSPIEFPAKGIYLSSASVDLDRVAVRRTDGIGAAVSYSSLEAFQSYIGDTLPTNEGYWGMGLISTDGAQCTLYHSTVERSSQIGILGDTSSKIELFRSLVIGGSVPLSTYQHAIGIGLNEGVELLMDGSAVRDAGTTGIHAIGGNDITVDFSLLHGNGFQPGPQSKGYGFQAADWSQVILSGVLLDTNMSSGMAISGTSSLIGKQLLVQGTVAHSNGTGQAFVAYDGATCSLENAHFAKNAGVAVRAVDEGTSINVSRGTVEDVFSASSTEPSPYAGQGIIGSESANVTVANVYVVRSTTSGVQVGENAILNVTNSHLEDTIRGEFLDDNGDFHDDVSEGLLASQAGTISAAGVLVAGCSRGGFLFSNSPGFLSSCLSTANNFGIVLQGEPKPELGQGVVAVGNLIANLVTDGQLTVPSEPTGTPEPPEELEVSEFKEVPDEAEGP